MNPLSVEFRNGALLCPFLSIRSRLPKVRKFEGLTAFMSRLSWSAFTMVHSHSGTARFTVCTGMIASITVRGDIGIDIADLRLSLRDNAVPFLVATYTHFASFA